MTTVKSYLSAVVALVRRDPIRAWAVTRSLGLAVVAFWPGLVTPDQMAALGFLGATLFGVDEVVRGQVTPTVKLE